MTNPEERRRVGQAVSDRIKEMNTSYAAVARAAGVSRATIRELARGERWPREQTRRRINAALGWPCGELARHAVPTNPADLHRATIVELADELCRRITGRTT